MPRKTRPDVDPKTLEFEKRRLTIEEMYLSGKKQAEIGAALGISQKTVSRDLETLREEWKQARLVQLDEAKGEELRKINNVERLAHEDYMLSRKITTDVQHAEPDDKGTAKLKAATKKVVTGPGDATFLRVIVDCVRLRCDILGLYAPKIKVWRQDELRRRLAAALSINPDDLPA